MSGHPLAAPSIELLPQVTVLDVRQHSMKNYNYLVVDPGTLQAVVVDPAWEMEKVEQAVAEAGATLTAVLITHAHRDHIDLANAVAEKYGCPIRMSKTEIAVSGFSAARLEALEMRPWTAGQMLIEPIFTPGHTPGSTCYRIGDNLFTGDVLFAEGCGICSDTEAAHAMFDSLQELKRRSGSHTRIYPGHSYGQQPGRTMSQLLQENIYLQFTDKQSFTAFRMRSGQDRARLFKFS